MEWFKDFIEETRQLWQEQKEFKLEEWIEEMEVLLEEMNSVEKGNIGEEHVIQLLSNREFYTIPTERSHTPSDICGIKLYKNYLHIVLIQVKTAKDQTEPEVLSKSKINELRIFTKFVLDRFKVSSLVPDEIKNYKPLISNGYAGVRLTDDDIQIVTSNSYTFWMKTSMSDFEELVKELVCLTHKLPTKKQKR